MSSSKPSKCQSLSRQTTEEDSNSDKDQENICPRTILAKHKTQLCKNYSELGYCPYQRKCRFAHGKHQLIRANNPCSSKNRKCNGFWKNGCCSYGIRCQFGHAQLKWQDTAIMSALEAACSSRVQQSSKLMGLLI